MFWRTKKRKGKTEPVHSQVGTDATGVEHPESSPPSDTPHFRVIVRDNFHYMDESEVFEDSTFTTYELALSHSQRIVDDFLAQQLKPGMSKEELFKMYTMFGEDPFIEPDDRQERFSAWTYAKNRCRQICDEEWWHDEY